MKIEKINQARIEQAIHEFEAEVDFEFIPIISNRSSYVEHIRWILSLLILILFVGSIEYFYYDSWAPKTWWYLLAPFVAIILGSILDKSDLVDRFCISKPERERQVFEKAQRLFFLKRLDENQKQNSLLLFISIMEREIVLLPDPRLQKLLPDQISALTTDLLRELQSHFKKEDYENGILSAIEMLKNRLKTEFPRTTAPENGVPNRLIWLHE